MALLALLFSVPLWLVPLVLVLPPLIWGWLTYRVMAFDALAEHASKDERREVLRRYRVTLLGMGILTGYLGAAPSIVWASGVVFAAAFVVLLPLAIWIYTLVLRFHRCGLLTSACRRWRNCVPPILRWAPPLLCAQQTVLLYRARQAGAASTKLPSTRLKSMAPLWFDHRRRRDSVGQAQISISPVIGVVSGREALRFPMPTTWR